jgi:hypothetical protein
MYGLPPGLTDADAARVWTVAGAGDAKVIHPEPDWRAALAAYGGFL